MQTKCPACNEKVPTSTARLVRHMKIHNDVSITWICAHCPRNFSTLYAAIAHLEDKHVRKVNSLLLMNRENAPVTIQTRRMKGNAPVTIQTRRMKGNEPVTIQTRRMKGNALGTIQTRRMKGECHNPIWIVLGKQCTYQNVFWTIWITSTMTLLSEMYLKHSGT
jgi:hypothetical protein